MSEKEALEYIEVKLDKSISSQSYYRLKKQVRSDPARQAWLSFYAKAGIVDHYRDRLYEMQMIQKDMLKMWVTENSKADNEQDKYLMQQIARSILENNVILSQLGVSLPIISSMLSLIEDKSLSASAYTTNENFTNLDLIIKEYKLIEYFGKIEDSLLNERGCTDIHLHDSMRLPDQIHLKDKRSGGTAHHGCTFVLQNNE